MAKIAFVAAAELPSTPEVAPLRMPKRKVSAANLSLAAHGMAETAGKYTDVMVAAGLPGDFVARLIAASDAMMEAVRERSSTVSKRSGATTGLVPKLQAARKIVRALDRFVRSELKDDPTLLRTWQSVQRVRRPGRSASGSAAPAIPGSSPVMTGTTAPTSTAPSAVAA
jgi:hypothetical protein